MNSFRVFFILGFLLAAGLSTNAYSASCNSVPMAITPASPLTYTGTSDGIPVGDAIGSWGGNVTVQKVFECGNAQVYKAVVTPIDTPVSGVIYSDGGMSYSVYPTGVEGIGYVIGMKDPNASKFIAINPPNTQTFPSSGTPAASSIIGFTAKVTYITTTGLKTGVYNIPSRVIATLDASGAGTGQTTLTLNGVTINVTATACEVNQSSLNVPLGEFNTTDFVGVGSTIGEKSFSVDLQCDANIKLNMTLNGTQSAETTDTSIIALTGAGTPDVAKGVGVQVIHNGNELDLGNKTFIKTTMGGGETISLIARYYQTLSQVTPGNANATATLYLTYE